MKLKIAEQGAAANRRQIRFWLIIMLSL